MAVRSVKQSCSVEPLVPLMETFRRMVNDCIRIGLQHDASTLKRLSILSYPSLSRYDIISYYKLNAISKAAGILANRKQSLKRGIRTRTPYLKKDILISGYAFKIMDGKLRVPIQSRGQGCRDTTYFDIPLNKHTREVLSDPAVKVSSFTLNSEVVSMCYSKEVAEFDPAIIAGFDRNLGNVTVGTRNSIEQYDLSKAVDIAENTRSIMGSFRRNDIRIRRKIAAKYGKRRRNRVNQLLHCVSKQVVAKAKKQKAAIAFEKLTHIRRMYRKGNYQCRNYRFKLNSWPYDKMKRQIEYKAAWEGIPIIQLSPRQTRGASQLCPQCGKRLQEAHYKDVFHKRQLYCTPCQKWMDRDVVAAMNIARKGAEVFQRSKGLAGEAMKGNPMTPVILRVDASKLSRRQRRVGMVVNST